MLAWVMDLGFAASDSGAAAVVVSQLSTLILMGAVLSVVTFLG